jgi:hypothetical protein
MSPVSVPELHLQIHHAASDLQYPLPPSPDPPPLFKDIIPPGPIFGSPSGIELCMSNLINKSFSGLVM